MKIILNSFVFILTIFLLNSCFGKDNNNGANKTEEVIAPQLLEKTDVEIAKENEDRLPYTKERIEKNVLLPMTTKPPITNLEEYLSIYTDEELAGIKTLTVGGNEIEKITGLERLPNLESLDALSNNIKDITGIHLPPKLKIIILRRNPVSDISYLYNFPQILAIVIEYTNVTSIEGIEKLENLAGLKLMGSKIEDFSPLLKLSKLRRLSTRFNPGAYTDEGHINPEYEELMERVFENNPDLEHFQYQ